MSEPSKDPSAATATQSATPKQPPDPPQNTLEAVLIDLPGPKQEQIKQVVKETLFAYIERGGAPRIDPETAKILTASADKDNEHKFHYLTQKQKDAADESQRAHNMKILQHNSRVKLCWPILWSALIITVGCIASGIYLAATGHDVLGSNIITGIFTAIFAYLGGLGTANFFKSN